MTVARHRLQQNFGAAAAAYDTQAQFQHIQTRRVFDAVQMLFPATARLLDIGCGTGRHWPKLYQMEVGELTGYDVSEGMLHRLHIKFPDAKLVKIISDDFLADVPDAAYDTIISTLTLQIATAQSTQSPAAGPTSGNPIFPG